MKHTKLFAMAIAAIMASSAIVSCDDDDDSKENKENGDTPTEESVNGVLTYCLPLEKSMFNGLDVIVTITDAKGNDTTITVNPADLKTRAEAEKYGDVDDALSFLGLTEDDSDPIEDVYFLYEAKATTPCTTTIDVKLAKKGNVEEAPTIDIVSCTPLCGFIKEGEDEVGYELYTSQTGQMYGGVKDIDGFLDLFYEGKPTKSLKYEVKADGSGTVTTKPLE